jgi:hypothetical protein
MLLSFQPPCIHIYLFRRRRLIVPQQSLLSQCKWTMQFTRVSWIASGLDLWFPRSALLCRAPPWRWLPGISSRVDPAAPGFGDMPVVGCGVHRLSGDGVIDGVIATRIS